MQAALDQEYARSVQEIGQELGSQGMLALCFVGEDKLADPIE